MGYFCGYKDLFFSDLIIAPRRDSFRKLTSSSRKLRHWSAEHVSCSSFWDEAGSLPHPSDRYSISCSSINQIKRILVMPCFWERQFSVIHFLISADCENFGFTICNQNLFSLQWADRNHPLLQQSIRRPSAPPAVSYIDHRLNNSQ